MSQKLKLSAETIAVLRNFSDINKSILVSPGNKLVTIAETKSIIGVAEVSEIFESEFAIYELSKFLSSLSVFDEPLLTIDDKRIVISEGSNKLNYTLTDKRTVLSVGDESIAKLDATVEKGSAVFELTNESFQTVSKARAILKLPEYSIEGGPESILIRATDTANPSSDSYEKVVGAGVEEPFKAVFRQENFKFLPKDYSVKFSDRGLARFSGEKVTYYVVAEAKK